MLYANQKIILLISHGLSQDESGIKIQAALCDK